MSDERGRLPPDLAALLSAERVAPPPSDEARGRVRDRLGQTLGLTLGTTAATAPSAGVGKLGAAAGKSAAASLGVAAKVSLTLVAVGGLAAGGWVGWRAARAPRVSPRTSIASSPLATAPAATAPTPLAPSPSLAPLAPSPSLAPAPLAPAAPSSRRLSQASQARLPRPAAPPAARHGSLAEERALLAGARTALADGDGDTALAAVERHAREYPDGQLSEERDSLRVRALAASGDHERARAAADEFARLHPRSLFLPAVRAASDGNP
jgi:hypothetical protein